MLNPLILRKMDTKITQIVRDLTVLKEKGETLPSLTDLLSCETINYDLVDALLVVDPGQIKKIDGYYSPKTMVLAYSVPASLDKELQKGEIRAICIVSYCLPEHKFEQACSTFWSKGKRRMLRRSYERFQEAKARVAAA